MDFFGLLGFMGFFLNHKTFIFQLILGSSLGFFVVFFLDFFDFPGFFGIFGIFWDLLDLKDFLDFLGFEAKRRTFFFLVIYPPNGLYTPILEGVGVRGLIYFRDFLVWLSNQVILTCIVNSRASGNWLFSFMES